jgi:hypothetical protein
VVLVDAQHFEGAATGPALTLNFERFAAGESLNGRRFCGMEIVGGSADPVVVNAEDTRVPPTPSLRDSANYRLCAPGKVLSPGGEVLAMGPQPAIEDDDLTLLFDPPVSAVAFTLLSTSADGLSFTEVSVYSATGELLYKGQVEMGRALAPVGSAYPGPGSAFWGCIAEAGIARIEIDEQDSDGVCPDSNIGFADIRFVPATAERSDDLNGDGVVDASDLAIYAEFWASDDPLQTAWLAGSW